MVVEHLEILVKDLHLQMISDDPPIIITITITITITIPNSRTNRFEDI